MSFFTENVIIHLNLDPTCRVEKPIESEICMFNVVSLTNKTPAKIWNPKKYFNIFRNLRFGPKIIQNVRKWSNGQLAPPWRRITLWACWEGCSTSQFDDLGSPAPRQTCASMGKLRIYDVQTVIFMIISCFFRLISGRFQITPRWSPTLQNTPRHPSHDPKPFLRSHIGTLKNVIFHQKCHQILSHWHVLLTSKKQ